VPDGEYVRGERLQNKFIWECYLQGIMEIDIRPSSWPKQDKTRSVPGRKPGSTSTLNANTTTNTTTIKSTGPHDRGFQQNLTNSGVYADEYKYPNGRVEH